MDNREKLVKQLFIGKVAEIIGDEKTIQLLKEANEAFFENFPIVPDPRIIPFTAESMVKSMVEFSKSIESTAKHLESLSKNSKPETDLEKKIHEAKEAMFQSNLSFEILTTEMQLSKYLCKNLINQIKEKQPDKFKCSMALKAELKFLVDRYGKI